MTQRSEPQLDNKGLATGVGSDLSENTLLPTLSGVGNRVGSFSEPTKNSSIDAETQGLATANHAITNPMQVGVGSSRSLSLESGELPTLAGSTDLLTLACDLHHRVNAGMGYLRTHIADSEKFERGRLRLERLVIREYAPLLTDIAAGSSPETLAAQRDELAARLERGWTIDKLGAAELFADLLTRYEVLEDVLAGRPVASIMERIARLEVVAA